MRKGQTEVDFNERFFDEILRSAQVDGLCRAKADQALAVARATAPVDTGAYRDGLAVEPRESAHRRSWRVVGHDPKTLLIEARTGNLARALKAVRS